MSSNHIIVDGKTYVPTKEAGAKVGYTHDYIAKMCRSGDVPCQQVARAWFVDEEALFAHVEEKKQQKEKLHEELSKERKREYGNGETSNAPVARAPVNEHAVVERPTITVTSSAPSPSSSPAHVVAPAPRSSAHTVVPATGVSAQFVALAVAVAAVGIPYASAHTPLGQKVGEMVAEHTKTIVAAIDRMPSAAVDIVRDASRTVAIDAAHDDGTTSATSASTFAASLPSKRDTKEAVDNFFLALANLPERTPMLAAQFDDALRNVARAAAVSLDANFANLANFHTASLDLFNDVSVAWYTRVSGFVSSFGTDDDGSTLTDAERDTLAQRLAQQTQEEEDTAADEPADDASEQDASLGSAAPVRERTVVREPVVEERVIERVVEVPSTSAGISEAEVARRLTVLEGKLQAQIFDLGSISAGNTTQIVNNYTNISRTNKIDDLGSVTIHDSSIKTSSFSGTSVSGDSGSFGTLDVSGATTLQGPLTTQSTVSLFGTLSVPNLNATSTTATSTFAGVVDIDSGGFTYSTTTGNTTLGGQLIVQGTGTSTVAGDVAFDTDTLYIDSILNRIGIGTTSPGSRLSVAGDIYSDTNLTATNITATSTVTTTDFVATNATTTNATSTNFDTGNLTADDAVITRATTTSATSTNFNTTNLTATDSTITDATITNSTTTNATTTNLSVSGILSATSGTATTTLAGGLTVETSGLVYDFSTNRVGIGTASPSTALQVDGALTFGSSAASNTTTGDIVGVGKLAFGGVDANGTQRIFSGSDYLSFQGGSTGARFLDVSSNEILTILDGGNVGVGTTSPAARFSVAGDIYADGTLTASSFSATSSISAPFFTATDGAATSTFAGGLTIETSGFVYDLSTNRVGIGTDSPNTEFHVIGSDNAFGRFETSSASNDAGVLISQAGGQKGYLLYDDSDDTLDIGVGNSTDAINIDATGQVGIGTTSPAAALAVADLFYVGGTGTSTIQDNLEVLDTLQVGSGSTFITGSSVSVDQGDVRASRLSAVGGAATSTFAGGLAIETSGFVYDFSTNRVGIGTASPESVFDVSSGSDFARFRTTNADSNSLIKLENDAQVWQIGNRGADLSDAFVIRNETGGADTLTITTGNDVGVGTTSPAQKLSVSGNTYITGGLGVGIATTTAGVIETTGDVVVGGAITINGALQSTVSSGQIRFLGTPSGTNIDEGSVYINPSTAGVNNVLLGLAVGGTEKLRIDAEGDVQITGLFNSTNTSGTNQLSGSLQVDNNTTLGSSNADTVDFNALVDSSFVPTTDTTYDLGSETLRWANIYAATSTIDNLVAGGTASSTFIINSTNTTADAEDSSLEFERGSETPNAILKWDSANDRFDFNDFAVRLQNSLIVAGTASSSVAGPLWATGLPQGTNIADASLYLNPASGAADNMLFAIAVAGNERFSVDAEGDTLVQASLGIENQLFDITQDTLTINDSIQVNGNLVKDSGGTTRLSIGTTNTITGNLTVTGTVSGASGSTFGNLTLADGSITDSSNAISFGDENLTTTGTLDSGNLSVTGTIDATGLATFDSGFLSHASSTITAGGLTTVGYSTTTQAFIAQGATATSTFAGGLAVETSGFVYDHQTNSVGIGTDSPSRTFDIRGGANVLVNVMSSIAAGSGGGGGMILGTDTALSSGDRIGFFLFGDDAGLGNATGITSFRNASGADLRFETHNGSSRSERLIIDPDGKVGLGTTTPNNKFTVFDTTSPSIEFSAASGDTNKWTFGIDTADGGKFKIASSSAVGTDTRLTIDGGGRLGVGVVDPANRLEVFETISDAQLKLSYDATRFTDFQVDSVGDLVINPQGNDVFLNDDNLWVCSGGSCPAGTPSGTGNIIAETAIGIGTSSPGTSLHVSATGADILRVERTGSNQNVVYSAINTDGTTYFGRPTTNFFAIGPNLNLSSSPYVSIDTSGSVGIGTTSPAEQLSVADNLFIGGGGSPSLGTATSTFEGDIIIGGKLDVGTIDPVYTIDGVKYATYGHSTIGIKEEVILTMAVEEMNADTGYYEQRIAFSELEKGSDLWLFYQITDFGKSWKRLAVTLTPGVDGRVFYQKSPDENELVIASTKPGEVSMRLVADRFDASKWPNLRPDQDGGWKGHIIQSKD